MAKLGYTWYVKDWNTSEAVFELNLEQRGFYRELIDLAMLNDNKVEIKLALWARKFASDSNTLQNILNALERLKLIETDTCNGVLSVPSCESRLNIIRGARKGGLKSKPTTNPTPKANAKPTPKATPKGIANQTKTKTKTKIYREFDHLKMSEDEFNKLVSEGYTPKQIDSTLDSIANYAKNKNYKSLYLTTGKWLKKEFPKVTATSSNMSLIDLMKQ